MRWRVSSDDSVNYPDTSPQTQTRRIKLKSLISAHPEMGVFNDVIASEARQSPAARANAG